MNVAGCNNCSNDYEYRPHDDVGWALNNYSRFCEYILFILCESDTKLLLYPLRKRDE